MKHNPQSSSYPCGSRCLDTFSLFLSGGATNCQVNTHVIKQPINTPEKHDKNVHTVNVDTAECQQLCQSHGTGERGTTGKWPRSRKAKKTCEDFCTLESKALSYYATRGSSVEAGAECYQGKLKRRNKGRSFELESGLSAEAWT